MKFLCERYPFLKVWDGSKVVAEFKDGIFETDDATVIELLKRISEVKVEEKAEMKETSKTRK